MAPHVTKGTAYPYVEYDKAGVRELLRKGSHICAPWTLALIEKKYCFETGPVEVGVKET